MNVVYALGLFTAGVSVGMVLVFVGGIMGEWLRGRLQRQALMEPPRELVFRHLPWRSHTGRREYLQ